jgi:hypothetical protein
MGPARKRLEPKMVKQQKESVAEAAALVAHLEQKLEDAITQREELGREREGIAFLAVGEQNRDALERIAEINSAILAAGEVEATVKAAIVEAKRRLASARQKADWDAERTRAKKVLVHLSEFVRHAMDLDSICAELVQRSQRMEAALRAMHAAGCGHPSAMLVKANVARAMSAALQGSYLEFQRLAPSDRHTFLELAEGWSAGVTNWAAQRGATAAPQGGKEDAA